MDLKQESYTGICVIPAVECIFPLTAELSSETLVVTLHYHALQRTSVITHSQALLASCLFPLDEKIISRPQPNEAADLISSPCKKWHCIIDQSQPRIYLCSTARNHKCTSVGTLQETKCLCLITVIRSCAYRHVIDKTQQIQMNR